MRSAVIVRAGECAMRVMGDNTGRCIVDVCIIDDMAATERLCCRLSKFLYAHWMGYEEKREGRAAHAKPSLKRLVTLR